MENYNKFIRNITELIEKGIYKSQELKKEIEDFIKFRKENVANKLNLVSREEFEIQKKLIDQIRKELNKIKNKKIIKKLNKKPNKAKKR